ncbi:MAG: hypothetical protein M3R65_05860 [Gemmatimonadota bacterium]|nr:hypothetical protein [Gemmatimonadota bacterium]
MNLERLRKRAQALCEEVAREGYLAYSGLKPEAALQAIYAQYPDILDDEVMEGCVARFREAPSGSEEGRAARMMLEWQVESRVGRQLAPLDEREVLLDNASVVRLADGTVIPYQRAAIDIANSADAAERDAIDVARARVVEESFAPLRMERLQRERDAVDALGIANGYVATFEALSGISLTRLANECEAFLRDTANMWDAVLDERLRLFGVARGRATRADSLAMFRLREFDDAFPASSMEGAIRRNCAEMGIDPAAAGRITFDIGDRAGKRPRAFCAPVRVPEQVYLVLRPHGGQADYGTFLHELGHALHFANARPDFPFEYRWLGDNSVTEGYAMLFDHRTQQRAWLQRYTHLNRKRAESYLRFAGFEELHFVRRYCAKLLYEIQVYSGATGWSALPDLYVETLAAATGFRYRRADAFLDLDSRFYSSRYLRAWQLQAVLEEALVARFDEDWWRNPAAGPWLVEELFAEGQRESADELAERVAGTGISFQPLKRRIEALLAG